MFRSFPRFASLSAICLSCLSGHVLGQTQKKPVTQAAGTDLIANGGFEQTRSVQNLWYGVNRRGVLAGFTGQLPVILQSGTIGPLSIPISVDIADMNGDQLNDLVTTDFHGYLRIFFNSGTPQEPKFTIGELAPVFLAAIDPNEPLSKFFGINARPEDGPYTGGWNAVGWWQLRGGREWLTARAGTSVTVTGMFGEGKNDLLVSNYAGELIHLPNQGSGAKPVYRQPSLISSSLIDISRGGESYWGNLFTPVSFDWSGDGREDLLLGEGSFSANNVHLLVNSGRGSKPEFPVDKRGIAAFGDGEEILTPTIADYNGDGKGDLLVGARSGRIGVYLAGSDKETDGTAGFSHFIEAGGRELKLPGVVAVSAGDLTGDGLFDLVFGKSNGEIAWSKNVGKMGEPKFERATEFKGEGPSESFLFPQRWTVDLNGQEGNLMAFANCVTPEEGGADRPAEGKRYMSIGYLPSRNQFLPSPLDLIKQPKKIYFGQSARLPAKVGSTYELSLMTRGSGVRGVATVRYGGSIVTNVQKTRGDRGRVQSTSDRQRENKTHELNISSGATWRESSTSFKVTFDNRDLNELDSVDLFLNVEIELRPGETFDIDNVKLIKKD